MNFIIGLFDCYEASCGTKDLLIEAKNTFDEMTSCSTKEKTIRPTQT